jgi:8-oxo-dGTP diphosphatase
MFEKLSITADTAIVKMVEGELSVLLVKRNRKPQIGHWGLLGGFVNVCPRSKDDDQKYQCDSAGNPLVTEETLEQTVRKVIKRDIGLTSKIKVNELKTYSKPKRDSRMRIISAFHYALISGDHKIKIDLGETATDYMWCPLNKLPKRDKMAFDHRDMLVDLKEHLTNNIKYYPLAFELTQREFTLPELKNIYEKIVGKSLENFSRKINSMYILEATGEKVSNGRGRPAPLFKYKGLKGGF